MFNYFWPILLVIAANCLYNICAKSTPSHVSPFASLCITYLVAAFVSAIMFFFTDPNKNLLQAFTKTNWTAIAFGITVVALEFGYINIYRVGWKVSTGSLVANLGLACLLSVVGFLFYHETISARQLMGMLICAIGLFMVSK